MPISPSSRRLVVLAALLAVVAGAGLGLYVFFRKPPRPPLPGPDSPLYQEYAAAFLVGVAALDVDRYELSNNKLSEAIAKVPEEPAAWADRGLLRLRNNELTEAAADLQHARELAPDSPEIDALLGHLAE